jgi:hypothetical protein
MKLAKKKIKKEGLKRIFPVILFKVYEPNDEIKILFTPDVL